MTIAKHAPPPPGVEPPLLWGTEERLRELFGDGISDLRVERRARAAALSLRRPLARLLPHLLRADQGRLRAGRAGGRGGAGGRPARLSRLQHRRRPRPGARADYLEVIATQACSLSISGCETRIAAPMKSTARKTSAGDRAALAERVGDRHRGEREKEGDDQSHRAAILPGEGVARLARGSAADRVAAAAVETSASATARTSRLPMITPSAISTDLGGLLGRADPEADRDRHLGLGLDRGDELGELRRQRVPLAGRADGRRRRRRTPRRLADPAGGARRASSARPAAPARARPRRSAAPISPASPSGQVGDDRPGGTRRRRARRANSSAPCASTMFE